MVGDSTARTWRSTYESHEQSIMATLATHIRQSVARSTAGTDVCNLLHCRGERLARFDDVVREHPGFCRGLVRRVVHGAGRDEKRLSRGERHRRLAFDLEHERAVEDVSDFLAGMRVPANGRTRLKLHDGRDGFAAPYRQLRLLNHCSLEARLLRSARGGISGKARDPVTAN